MENILLIILFIPLAYFIYYVRFKLTKWEEIVLHFESEKRPELNPIYGFWSEFRHSPKSYPLSNTLLKVATTSFGIYLQYNLKFELIKFYKPVMIPWENITVEHSEEAKGKGCDEYIVSKNESNIGSIFIQIPISDQIVNEAKSFGVDIRVSSN